jgi:hypothetical protein
MTFSQQKIFFWANCISICTDGAAALTEHKKGFQVEVQQIGPHVNFIHSKRGFSIM